MFQDEKVFWPEDGRCHRLLYQGPCREGEWLVMKSREVPSSSSSSGRNRTLSLVCQLRPPCPCTARDPVLCEVQYTEEEGQAAVGQCGERTRCMVAMAAEQVSPGEFGFVPVREEIVYQIYL